ncbi:MAG: T9SS type A sorting domain-containing protein [Bacteroidetes bacterium]|nr:T9SS type A sorting domain-containing protein [Bacteroidota bacterium]
MKNIILFILLLSLQKAFGQNNPIFYGGNGDGWSMSSYLQTSNTTINHGNTGDGWSTGTYLQASNTTINHGGVGDGWNTASHLSASNTTLNHGGGGDGYAFINFMPNALTPSHSGGEGDGWALTSYLPVVSQTVYKGGEGDGWASNVIPLGPLPVELLSFTGRDSNEKHVLNWVTSMELNASHFVIEHSINAQQFAELGMRDAAGNSSTEQKYTFTNMKPVLGNNYYRLKMVDQDQKHKYSNVILLKLLKDHSSFSIFPNPAANRLHIQFSGLAAGSVMALEVLDAGGKLLDKQTHVYDNTTLSLNISSYANGLYFLKIQSGSISEIVKFSIQK